MPNDCHHLPFDGSSNGSRNDQKPEDAKAVELFGGAILCRFPNAFIDVSTMRQIPDNQEVWLRSSTSLDCFIVELLQFQEDAAEDNPLEYFFQDLAAQNDCDCTRLLEGSFAVQDHCFLPSDNNNPFVLRNYIPSTADGEQNYSASVSVRDTANHRVTVSIGAGVQHVPSKKQYPLQVHEKDSSWIHIEMLLIRFWGLQTDILITYSKQSDVLPKANVPSLLGSDKASDETTEFIDICKSLKIVDWKLFA